MYSESITDCKAAQLQNSNNLSCGKCAYSWIENRGLPPDRLACPRCGSKIVRRGLVQSGRRPTSAIDELIEVMEFVEGDGTYSRRSHKE